MTKGSTRLAIVLTMALTATGASAQNPPIKIGVPIGLSGANSVVAPSVMQSAELAVEEINAAGGVLGRQLQLYVADDASGAAGAQKAFDSLVFQKEVDVVITMETSAARNAGLPIVAKGDIPYIYTSVYEGRSCHPNLYLNGWVPEQQVPTVVDNFIKARGAQKFFLIGSDYAFGRGMLEFARTYIEKNNAEVVGEQYLPMEGNDWTAIISELKRSGADALITSTAGGAPNVTLTKQLRGAGVTLPYANLAIDEGTAKSMGADAAGIYIAASYITSIDSPTNEAFLRAMEKKFGAKLRTPNDLSVPQYEAVHLYKEAVEKAGTTDTKAVLSALGDVSFTGPRGTVSMNKQHHAKLTMYLAQVQTDGSVKIVHKFEGVDPGEQCPNL